MAEKIGRKRPPRIAPTALGEKPTQSADCVGDVRGSCLERDASSILALSGR
jgi:hypothetical protein